MTLNLLMEAVAKKLTTLWPDRKVYVNKLSRESDGQFFVGIIESSQEKHLDRRRKRSVQMQVLYFLQSQDNLEFNDWAEAMYDNFETLDVEEDKGKSRTIHLSNLTAREDGDSRIYQFLFNADFYVVLASAPGLEMESLNQKEELK